LTKHFNNTRELGNDSWCVPSRLRSALASSVRQANVKPAALLTELIQQVELAIAD
jgi:hypothetical protein